MQKSIITIVVLLVYLSFSVNNAVAKTEKKRIPAPSVLLVKLPTYTQKITVYRKAYNDKYANQCIMDAAAMQAEIIKDFKDNFTFCRYYFFYDTCSNLIIGKKFNGILLDTNLSPVSGEAIVQDDTSFQIAYFGNYINEAGTIENTNTAANTHNNPYFVASKKQRLVVVDRQFKNLPDPAPNGANMHYGILFNKYPSTKTYKSKLFDVYYVHYAGLISSEMSSYYGRK
jgi:hypothetical protein